MKWLAKDRYNLIDVAGITLLVKFLLDKSFVAALITLITASFLSAVVIFISKMGDKA